MKTLSSLGLAAAVITWLAACAGTPGTLREAYFHAHVQPVFEQHCVRCHSGATPPAGLNLTEGRLALAARHTSGKRFLVPGQPDQSLLLTAIARNGTHPKLMPRADLSLTEDQIGELREWIEDGAFWPAGTLHHVPTGENR